MNLSPQAQFEDEQRLDQWLGQMYRSDVLGMGNKTDTENVVRNLLDADQRLQAAAQRKLNRLGETCKRRDEKTAFIEHWQYKNLKKVMTNG